MSKEKESPNPQHRREEPQQHVDQVNPDSVLHSLYPRNVFGSLVNEHLPEDPKDRCP